MTTGGDSEAIFLPFPTVCVHGNQEARCRAEDAAFDSHLSRELKVLHNEIESTDEAFWQVIFAKTSRPTFSDRIQNSQIIQFEN
jgi:hypothetical protein